MSRFHRLRLDAGRVGGLLVGAGMLALTRDSLLAAALGMELVAAGFWTWARAAEDAREQVPRWAWLRRPASALWIAVGIHAAVPGLLHEALLTGSPMVQALSEA